MTGPQTNRTLEELGKRVASQFGIYVPPERLNELSKKLSSLPSKFGFTDEQQCLSHLAQAEWAVKEVEALVECLTVPETYFFRDAALWNFIANVFLPKLKARGTGINAWSAACCTGEEPYSLAMSIDAIVGTAAVSPVKIVASDLNSVSLNKAQVGDYGPWALRATPAPILDEYFKSHGGKHYRLDKRILNMVQFRQFNLMDLERGKAPPMVPPGGFDIIFCRNVLIYFSAQQSAAVIEQLHKQLAADGILIIAPCDIDLASPVLFETHREIGLLVLSKRKTPLQPGAETLPPRLRPLPSSTLATASGTPPSVRDTGTKIQTLNQRNDQRSDAALKGRSGPLSGPVSGPISARDGIPVYKPGAPAASKTPTPPKPPVPPAQPPAQVPAQVLSSGASSSGSAYISAESADQLVMRGQYDKAVQALLPLLPPLEREKKGHGKPTVTPDVEHYLVLLHALANLGRDEEALRWVDQSLTTFPLNEVLYFWRAVLFQHVGKDLDAVQAFKQAIFVDADFVMAHFSLFMLFNKLGRTAEAEVYRRNTQELLSKFTPDSHLPCSEELTARQIDTIMKSLVNEDGRQSIR